jgi:hypothetical protein
MISKSRTFGTHELGVRHMSNPLEYLRVLI